MRTRIFLALGAFALLLTGCAGIPYTSKVNVGDAFQAEEDPGLVIDAPSARPGESADAIVRGFIRAAASSRSDYFVARSFLGGDLAAKWNSGSRVLIHEANLNVQQLSETKFIVEVPVVAEIDDHGLYIKSPAGKIYEIEFNLELLDGEWRITSTDDGIILPRRIFTEVFNSYDVYFYNYDSTYLVPDTRWFVARSSIPTTLVAQLLNGPSAWLKDTLVTAFPAGTALAINAVTVENGVATIELNAEYLTTDASERELIHGQIDATLRNISKITSSRITVNGQEVSSSSEDGGILPIAPRISDRPMITVSGVQAEGIGYVTDGGFEVTTALQNRLAELSPNEIVFNYASQKAAVATDEAVYAISVSRKDQIFSGSFRSPSIDHAGRVWAINTVTNALSVGDGTNAFELSIPRVDNSSLSQIAVSREATRIVFAIQQGDDWQLWSAGIGYDPETKFPSSIHAPLLLSYGQGVVQTLTWQSNNTVLALVQSNSSQFVLTQQIGGSQSTVGLGWSVANIAATNVADAYFVLSTDGDLRQRVGDGWNLVFLGADYLVQQG
ncbi:MAG: GerMN domain-containing protein [Microbacteriaceae bacterium]|nr:GerMN domain-containing protein [Microbacteriaceae bacterium]